MIPFILFTLGGTLFLLLFHVDFGRRSFLRAIESQAESNAEFFRSTNLPMTPQIAAYLARVLDAEVEFRHPHRDYPPPPDGKLQVIKNIDASHELVITRNRPSWLTTLIKPQPLIALLAFWVVTLALTYVVARNAVQPILELNTAIPEIDSKSELPGEKRSDEIGALARTFRQTHEARSKAEKSGALAAVATSFAHEIKNPLAAASMHLDLLENPEGTQVIKRQLKRIEQLVQQWQFLMRPVPPSTSEHPLPALVNAAIERLRPAAEHAEVYFETELEDAVIQADGNRLSQVFDNLLMNAIQAMPDGGKIQIQSSPNGLLIRDEGPGFDQHVLAQLGELFVSTREGGMGIGLSVCKQIMEAHQGQLIARNRSDRSGGEIHLVFMEFGTIK